MELQGRTGIIAVSLAVVALVGLLFLIGRVTLGERPHNVSKDNAPDYAKQSGMVETGGTPTRPRAPYGAPPDGGRPGMPPYARSGMSGYGAPGAGGSPATGTPR